MNVTTSLIRTTTALCHPSSVGVRGMMTLNNRKVLPTKNGNSPVLFQQKRDFMIGSSCVIGGSIMALSRNNDVQQAGLVLIGFGFFIGAVYQM